ncbi:unnamed protein product (macronuclear) [Paramecium tetraurelia]|uniref:Cell division control protein 73 C-terminal domain-containing protein n=1 Tax=Paramecium tetraurelia TaxID=5888 RepID=A0CKM8_PARTE|nr:uncharacterized protein GSPATT00001059001 [Paramecium tetraurelia]CAK71345.1 unnamed protein product [Paramecium tetraurelia]|eukprot:XP_001438742.1 hypothetical protein (macronuclear) [Paramecium tetraurelia strain d4-2]
MFRKGRNDPLELLRDHVIHHKQIKLKSKNTDHRLLFDNNIEFKCSTETAWKSKSGQEYTLGALWCFLDCHLQGLEQKNYRKKALDLNFEQVFKADNQDIIEYFTGKVDYTDCINADKKASLYNKKALQKDEDVEFASQKKVKPDSEKEPLTEKEFNLKVFDEILRFEKPITTRNRLFRVQDRTFDDILKTSQKIFQGQYVGVGGDEEELQQILGTRTQDVNKAKQLSTAKLSYSVLNEFIKSKEKPIIIVPQIAELGNLCLKNVQQFLEQGQYLDPNGLKFTNESRSVQIKVKLRLTDIEQQFLILDTPNTITNWKRVVAVFLRGSTYELKQFPDQNPNQLFKNIRGYHLKFEEEKLKDLIKQWNVKVFDLHRSKRYQDIDVVNAFWEDLEAFLLRPAKLPSQQ